MLCVCESNRAKRSNKQIDLQSPHYECSLTLHAYEQHKLEKNITLHLHKHTHARAFTYTHSQSKRNHAETACAGAIGLQSTPTCEFLKRMMHCPNDICTSAQQRNQQHWNRDYNIIIAHCGNVLSDCRMYGISKPKTSTELFDANFMWVK